MLIHRLLLAIVYARQLLALRADKDDGAFYERICEEKKRSGVEDEFSSALL